MLAHPDKPISPSILFSLKDVSKGEARTFMIEKPRSTLGVDGGISSSNLKSLFYKHKVNFA